MIYRKKKRQLSLVYNDYAMQVLSVSSNDLTQAIVKGIPLDEGIVVDGVIEDELAFFEVLKEQVKQWGLKGQAVRFFVPDRTVMMKVIDHPQELKDEEAIKEFVEMELGRSIHLPFEDSLIDIYDAQAGDGKATLFATSADEVQKLIGLLDDAGLTPVVADIKAISNLRLLELVMPNIHNSTTLITDWSINELTITIYSQGEVEFLRYQTINTERSKWHSKYTEGGFEYVYGDEKMNYKTALMEPLSEIDRILNFYHYSLNKGEKNVDDIVVMGDSPELPYIIDTLESQLTLPIHTLTDQMITSKLPNFKASQSGLAGLALKEVE
ncbi:pilus assembly protein PilM [Viridibacillus sp. YIM B01967]|uniref:Pilus assembly protein PilM n=1 Tax=Viridibacillus soli TaxID=2798301 RepID=A0ABS1H208_9BACL|nr:pilus assembly protein PilM [Viridibacillus soli]MBK3493442.1 pilus assembly protein PilM [Viridibacillus soli]